MQKSQWIVKKRLQPNYGCVTLILIECYQFKSLLSFNLYYRNIHTFEREQSSLNNYEKQ